MLVHHPVIVRFGPLALPGVGLGMLAAFGSAQVAMTRELARRAHAPAPTRSSVPAAV